MLIFDGFKTEEQAKSFQAFVQAHFTKATYLALSQEESDKIDPFPYPLTPPIVLVERDFNQYIEQDIQTSVNAFGGTFAGT